MGARKIAVLVLVAAAFVAGCATSGGGDPVAVEESAQAGSEDVQFELDSALEEIEAVSTRVDDLELQVSDAVTQLDDLSFQIEELTSRLDGLEGFGPTTDVADLDSRLQQLENALGDLCFELSYVDEPSVADAASFAC